jgi:hypothetical protein
VLVCSMVKLFIKSSGGGSPLTCPVNSPLRVNRTEI